MNELRARVEKPEVKLKNNYEKFTTENEIDENGTQNKKCKEIYVEKCFKYLTFL